MDGNVIILVNLVHNLDLQAIILQETFTKNILILSNFTTTSKSEQD